MLGDFHWDSHFIQYHFIELFDHNILGFPDIQRIGTPWYPQFFRRDSDSATATGIWLIFCGMAMSLALTETSIWV